jgi:uncharacterized protein YjbI with pentapeptide repeats
MKGSTAWESDFTRAKLIDASLYRVFILDAIFTETDITDAIIQGDDKSSFDLGKMVGKVKSIHGMIVA